MHPKAMCCPHTPTTPLLRLTGGLQREDPSVDLRLCRASQLPSYSLGFGDQRGRLCILFQFCASSMQRCMDRIQRQQGSISSRISTVVALPPYTLAMPRLDRNTRKLLRQLLCGSGVAVSVSKQPAPQAATLHQQQVDRETILRGGIKFVLQREPIHSTKRPMQSARN